MKRDLTDAMSEIDEAEREHHERMAAMNPSLNQEEIPRAGWQTPNGRDLDALTNEAMVNPRADALKLQQQNEQILALKL